MNLITTFLETADRMGEKPAVVSGDGARIGYAALAIRSAAAASAWRERGIGKGDRVLVAMPIGVELYIAIAALWRLGATIVFPEPAMGLRGLKHAVAMTGPKAVLTSGWYRLLPFLVPALWPVRLRLSMTSGEAGEPVLEQVDAGHPALISFTSGSTGAPKGIERSHGFLAAQNACVAHMLASERDEIDLVAFPVFVIANLSMGTTSVLPDWKLSRHEDATAVGIAALIRREKVTRALVPPSICETMANGGIDPGLRTIFTGGGPIFPDLMQALRKTMPATSVMMVYGSTEAEPVAHQRVEDISSDQWQAMQQGAGLLAGRPVEETSLRIIDEEIVVTGDHVNKTYLGGHGDAENKLRMDGGIWHRTGDAGRLDGDGNLWLRGRLSGKSGDIYPFEVEVAARCWPGVRRAALVPDAALLALEGEEAEAGDWDARASALGLAGVVRLDAIPLDRRHRSKVDYTELRRLVSSRAKHRPD
jgi:acyl-CoA synthetase (AMP-forming)/AMP-acid ligase II